MRSTRCARMIAWAAACAGVLAGVPSAVGSQLSAVGSQLSAVGSQLPAAGSQLPAASSQPPATSSQPPATSAQPPTSGTQLPEQEQLKPTVHAALPQNIDDYWFAPRPAERTAARNGVLAEAAEAYASANYAASLTYARQAVAAGGPLLPYAQLYLGQSLVRLGNGADAEKTFDAILERKPEGYLSVAASIGKAEALQLAGRHAAAAEIYERLSTHKSVSPEDILSRLARAAIAAGDRKRAGDAWLRVYYEFPLSEDAKAAADALVPLQDLVTKNFKRDLGRALILFGAKRYTDARSAFVDLQQQAGGDDREVVELRIAECDYFLKRYAAARDGVQPYLEGAARRAEARFFSLSAIRALGDKDESTRLTRALVDDFPDSSWSSEALNNLGTEYLVADEDDLAAQTFKELFEKFPSGPYAERSAWKYGWRAYTTGNYAETVRVFERAAATFPRSDYRPSYLYWSGRAREKLGQREAAQARLRLVRTDYKNSYYGRLAARLLGPAQADGAQAVPAAYRVSQPQPAPVGAPPPTAGLIRRMLAAGLYDAALEELRFAQKAWGTSPAIEATMAWTYHERGELRRAITAMRRAYPQFLAESGESLPAGILQVIFPLTYWDAIKKNAALYELDPYVVASLILQESNFDPAARSHANAWGLMQIIPPTGRRLAVAVGIRRFNTAMLTNGDTNIRLGTLYFKRLVAQFGGVYYALASYNAGENRVVRWKAERPGMEEDEFIDDIPFPETQNYVKRVLGIAEDYRRLYGEGEGRPSPVVKRPTTKKSTTSSTTKKKAPAKKKSPTRKKR
jgi:peptidoglycan lytic transglycosylase